MEKYNAVKNNMTAADAKDFLDSMDKAKKALDDAKTKMDASNTDKTNGDADQLQGGLEMLKGNLGGAVTAYTNAGKNFSKATDNSKAASKSCETSNAHQFDALVTLGKYIKKEEKKEPEGEECTVTLDVEGATPEACSACTDDCLELLPLDDEFLFLETPLIDAPSVDGLSMP